MTDKRRRPDEVETRDWEVLREDEPEEEEERDESDDSEDD